MTVQQVISVLEQLQVDPERVQDLVARLQAEGLTDALRDEVDAVLAEEEHRAVAATVVIEGMEQTLANLQAEQDRIQQREDEADDKLMQDLSQEVAAAEAEIAATPPPVPAVSQPEAAPVMPAVPEVPVLVQPEPMTAPINPLPTSPQVEVAAPPPVLAPQPTMPSVLVAEVPQPVVAPTPPSVPEAVQPTPAAAPAVAPAQPVPVPVAPDTTPVNQPTPIPAAQAAESNQYTAVTAAPTSDQAWASLLNDLDTGTHSGATPAPARPAAAPVESVPVATPNTPTPAAPAGTPVPSL